VFPTFQDLGPGLDVTNKLSKPQLKASQYEGPKKLISRFTVLTYFFMRKRGTILKLIAAVKMILTSDNFL
jgi:hypothetical protein